jgi:hypothetical protein
MAEDVMTVETQPESTIAQAYEQEHGDPTGAKRKPERAAESGRNQSLADEEGTAREIGESERQRRIAKVQPTQSLADAHAGLPAPEAETFELPDGFSDYSAEDIQAVLGLMGLKEEDLQEPRFAALALKELESSFSPVESEDGEENEEEETEEQEDTEEEKKEEEKPVEARPSKLAELTPEQRVEMSKHIEQVWNRSQQVNDPIHTEHFENSLAGILGTPPEQMETLHNVVEVLQFGAQNLIESTIPAMVQAYLQHNFAGVMEGYAPGFAANYTQQTISRTWDAVRGNDLPAFGTVEFDELAKEVHEKHPFLNDIDFKDAKGNPLPVLDALRAKAELTARLCRGERVTPQTIQDAVERGKADANRSNRRVSAQRSLGKGKSSGRIGQAESSGTSLRDAYTAQHGRDGGIA